MIKERIKLLVLPSIQNIEEIIKGLPIELTKAYYSSIKFIFKNNSVEVLHGSIDLKSFDSVWLSSYWASRDLACAVKSYLDSHGIQSTHVESSPSKLTDIMNFCINDIVCPDTFYVENSELHSNIQDLEDVCGYPMIMKDIKGCGGENSKYIENRERLIECINERKTDRKFIFQRFIPNNYDWGILVANNRVVSGEMSTPKEGEFRNNVGATENFVSLDLIPDNIKDIAIKASNALGLSWSRSDIVVDKNTGLPYLLEVNRFPGITEESSEVSGATVFLKNFVNLESS